MLGMNDNRRKGSAAKGQGKDLQRLSRIDLLELLVSQMREADDLRITIEERDHTISNLTDLADRLKDKLDLKDGQIDHLKERLDDKDALIGRLKSKLDDKDELIEKLKHRLDVKDQLIVRLSEADGINDDMLMILDARGHVGETGVSEG